jgi:hypothetical protein
VSEEFKAEQFPINPISQFMTVAAKSKEDFNIPNRNENLEETTNII